jgi:parallel beta-helix repeat protein
MNGRKKILMLKGWVKKDLWGGLESHKSEGFYLAMTLYPMMIRRIVAVWLCLILIVSSIAIFIEIAPIVKAPSILYVGGGGAGNYSTIQWAIDNASDGDTVFVYNGIYYENVLVNKTITLIGEDVNTTIIDGSGVDDVVYITSNWVNITRFTIRESGSGNDQFAGIALDYADNCSIMNNTISNNNNGIYMDYSSYCDIYSNQIESNGRKGMWQRGISSYSNIIQNKIISNGNIGIYITSASYIDILNNNISLNQEGITLIDTTDSHIFGNNITQNVWNGINFHGAENCEIAHNAIANNQHHGIESYDSTDNKIENNSISENYNYGIRLYQSDSHYIVNNTFLNDGIFLAKGGLIHRSHIISEDNLINGKPLIFLKNNSSLEINGLLIGQLIILNCTLINITNLTIDNTDIGIEVYLSSEILIESNNISQNIYGVFADRSSDTFIRNNTLDNNRASGIYFTRSRENFIEEHYISNNEYGIYLYYQNIDNILNLNYIHSNQKDGIYLESSCTNNNVDNNTIFSNNGNGIYLYTSSSNIITFNNISLNIENGYYSWGSGYNLIKGNKVSLNTEIGIYCHGNFPNDIIDNEVVFNYKQGILIHTTTKTNNIIGNNVSSNKDHGIRLRLTSNANVLNNYISNNSDDGIFLWYVDNSIIKNNCISSNMGDGIHLSVLHVFNNIIINNNVSSNIGYGFNISSAEYNIIFNNLVSENQYGFYLFKASNNSIYFNNIINNMNQAYDDKHDNNWNNTYPLSGNYWSDYFGTDNYKGPNQDIPGSDGIGDTNYSIDIDSVDNYPLIQPIENYSLLFPGWNLISTPYIQQKQDIASVLEMIDGYYDAVQWYDVTELNDHWKHNKLGKPHGNDLVNLNENKSFWINVNASNGAVLLHNGTHPASNQNVQIHPGWNMVGYPSHTSYDRAVGLNNLIFGIDVDCIQWYDAFDKTWHFLGSDDDFVPGMGYWVHSKVEATWEVPI